MSRSECWTDLKPRDPKRIDEVLALVGMVWKANPDLRLGQLLLSLTPTDKDLFVLDDDVLRTSLQVVANYLAQGKTLGEALSAIPK